MSVRRGLRRRVPAGPRRTAASALGWLMEAAGGQPPGYVAPALVARVDGPPLDARPLVIGLLIGVDRAAAARCADQLARAVVSGGPRVLVVVDGPHFDVVRGAGLAVDHVLSRGDWQARGHATSWEQHLAAELRRLRRDLRTERVVDLTSPGAVEALGAAGSAPARRKGRTSSIMAGLERSVDRGAGRWP